MRTWMIGSGADCDLVVARPTVSGCHCRLTETEDGHILEDLGSSNGTYVNGVRITSATRVTAADTITLGLTAPMPWPEAAGAPGTRVIIRIGRNPDNDLVLDDPRVSGHHARLIVTEGSGMVIEDLGSSNGTFVNAPDRRAGPALPLIESDVVYFGSLAVPAARLLPPRTEGKETIPPAPAAVAEPAMPAPAAMPSPIPIAARAIDPWTVVVLAQAPVIAILIVLGFGRQAAAAIPAASGTAVAQGIAATLFALALAAIWLGGSLSAWAFLAGRSSPEGEDSLAARLLASASPGARPVILGGLCAVECAVLLAIVHWGSGLSGSWLAMFGLLVLASVVGLLLGWVVFALSPTPWSGLVVLLAGFVVMIALGGGIWRLAAPSSAVRIAAAALPSRWTFEGLLLLEADRRPPQVVPEGPEPEPESDPDHDLAADFFPAATERMGIRADAMALGFMLIGLAAATAFISASSKS
jgi:pSer/pThr/pTyr-binding forkhead associated (FHA) protein